MKKSEVLKVLNQMNEEMQKEKDHLTELDNIIADGDHGINMARGFAAAAQKLASLEDKDLGTVFKTVGMTLVSAIGGSAGPLYGTAFMRSGAVMAGKDEIGIDDFITCLTVSVEGIMARGKAVAGEKTMLDAMIPALESMKQAAEDGKSDKEVLESGVAAANAGVEYTKTIAATKGRASYIGERSIGHEDPGAVSFTDLLTVVAMSL